MFLLPSFIAQVRLEDVFRSTQENMTQTPGSGRMVGLVVGGVAVLLLLLLLQQFRKRTGAPRPVNHHGRLLRELAGAMPLRAGQLKQLRKLAERQSCSSPLVLLLCPSLLSKAVAAADPAMRKSLEKLAKELAGTPPDDEA